MVENEHFCTKTCKNNHKNAWFCTWNRTFIGVFGGENLDIKEPYMNNYCDKCKNHYLLDGDESRCRAISLGMSSAMCVQVKECHKFKEK